MPSVTHDGQSFAIDGRRLWLVGASLAYARIPEGLWARRIAAVKQAGFNTVLTGCPWLLHEPRKDRFVFEQQANVRQFVELCAAAGLRVVLRPGPYIGDGYDGGGLPSWLMDVPDLALRQANGPFLERVSLYFRKLFAELADLDAAAGGPIILVQSEHAWLCSNPEQAERYLREITRTIRESGVSVPITNANDLWQESVGTIDTWRGWDDLLAHLRQLRGVQPDAPRVVSSLQAAPTGVWGQRLGGPVVPARPAADLLQRMAHVLAAGAQPLVEPFHGGTNFDFLAGRLAGGPDRFATTSAAAAAPLGEAGYRGPSYHAVRRLAMFANHFGHLFADLDPTYHPVTLDVSEHQPAIGPGIVPLRGPAGRVVFVFDRAGATDRREPISLLLEDGLRMPVHCADQTVGWFVFNVDLDGSGRLDYANLCPWAVVGRSILVLHGAEKARAMLSINGSPLEATVPAGAKPTVVLHKNVTVVICNRSQIDAAYHDDSTVYVGVSGLDDAGRPLPHADWPRAWLIARDAAVRSMDVAASRTRKHPDKGRKTRSAASSLVSASLAPAAVRFAAWQACSTRAYVDGTSPRFASLDGPQTLPACGAPSGYGWYRATIPDASPRRVLLHWPDCGDRVHLYQNGQLDRIVGFGPGAQVGTFALKLAAGDQHLVALADNFGRFAEGNDMGRKVGVFGPIYEVRPLRTRKPQIEDQEPVDPFDAGSFIIGATHGQLSAPRQAVWQFNHVSSNPILIDIATPAVSGTLVLNDRAIGYHGGVTGAGVSRWVIDPSVAGRRSRKVQAPPSPLKRGRNVLRFAPDVPHEHALPDLIAATTLLECVGVLTGAGAWAFAKWQPPTGPEWRDADRSIMASMRGAPCWWRNSFSSPVLGDGAALWLDTAGLSKGYALVNGRGLGRYFTADAAGKSVGPQTRLYIPEPWLNPGQRNDIMFFDEHGFAPSRCRLVISSTGDLDGD